MTDPDLTRTIAETRDPKFYPQYDRERPLYEVLVEWNRNRMSYWPNYGTAEQRETDIVSYADRMIAAIAERVATRPVSEAEVEAIARKLFDLHKVGRRDRACWQDYAEEAFAILEAAREVRAKRSPA